MIPPGDVGCVYEEQNVQPEPYGGIGGPGVIAVVVGTAWAAVGVRVLHYLFASSSQHNFLSSPIDAAVARLAGFSRVARWLKSKPGTQEALAKAILTMSDVQTLVGLALLVSGFLGLPSGISAYHFMLVVRIAWFSHVTQLAGLSILRHDQPRSKRWTRLFLAAVLAGLLIAAIIPTLFFNWAYVEFRYEYPDYRSLVHFVGGSASLPGSRARCFFDMSRNVRWHYASGNNAWTFGDTPAFGSGVAAIVLIVLNLVTRTVKLQQWFDKPLRAARHRLSRWWTLLLEGVPNSSGAADPLLERLVFYTGLATLVTARLYTDLLISALSGVYWLLVPAIWGTISLVRTRSTVDVQDSKWTFSQALPVLILVAVLATALGSFFSRETETPAPILASEHEPLRSPSPLGSNSGSPAQEPNMNLSFHEHAAALLERDRDPYNPAACAWMSAAVALPLLQIFTFTALLFHTVAHMQPNIASALVYFLIPISVGIPSASFAFTLLALGYEALTSGRATARAYRVLMALTWVATGGAYTVLYFGRPWPGLEIMKFVVAGVGGVIAVLNVFSVMLLAWRYRNAGIQLV